jgi:hypothetical protein
MLIFFLKAGAVPGLLKYTKRSKINTILTIIINSILYWILPLLIFQRMKRPIK